MIKRFLHKNFGLPYKLKLYNLRKVDNAKATVVFIHGLGASSYLWKIFKDELLEGVDIFAVDLLGHGKSPKPNWEGGQSLKANAKALRRTFSIKNISNSKPVILVGHSLGSLVAIEFAERFWKRIDSLILVSPPIYTSEKERDLVWEKFLKAGYNFALKNQKITAHVGRIVTKNLMKGGDQIRTPEDIVRLSDSLRTGILKQNSFENLMRVKVPTRIIYGRFDPLVIGSNFRRIARLNSNVNITTLTTSHDLTTVTIKRINQSIKARIKECR